MDEHGLWSFVITCTPWIIVGALMALHEYWGDERVALRAIQRMAKRIRKLSEQIERRERGAGVVDEYRLVEAISRVLIAEAEWDLVSLRKALAVAVVEWKNLVEDYHELFPPPAPDETVSTYRVATPKVRVAPVIKETEELLEHLERKALAADS